MESVSILTCSVDESSDTLKHVSIEPVIDLWEHEELAGHLYNHIDEVERPEEPHVPYIPKTSSISVEENIDKSDDVSSEWSKNRDSEGGLVELHGEVVLEKSNGSPSDNSWPVSNLMGEHGLPVGSNDTITIKNHVDDDGESGMA